MNINDLINNHPEICFYKLSKSPGDRIFQLDNIDDLFKLTKVVGYFETRVSSKETIELAYQTAIDMFLHSLPRDEAYFFKRYVNEHEAQLQELCKVDGNDEYIVYEFHALDFSAFCEIIPNKPKEIDLDSIMTELERMYKMYIFQIQEENAKRNREKEIQDSKIDVLIDSFRERYINAVSKRAKDEIIQEVRIELKKQFGLDGRSDYRASSAHLRSVYESDN